MLANWFLIGWERHQVSINQKTPYLKNEFQDNNFREKFSGEIDKMYTVYYCV